MGRTFALGVVAIGALWLAPATSAYCDPFHGDPIPSYEGPLTRGISCQYSTGPEEMWEVPAEVVTAEFGLRGADDPLGGRGGYVKAPLPVVPGETLVLRSGGNGAASSVSRGVEVLLVAGGGDGNEPNYIAPAEWTAEEAPGGPLPPYPGDGSVYVTWRAGWHPAEKDPATKGKNPQTKTDSLPTVEPACRVPKVNGRRPAAARRALADANCRVGRIARRPARRARRNRVVAQSEPAGATLPAGAAVDLIVGGAS